MTDDVKELIERFDGPWHCFQCGDVCNTKDEAEAHFGYDPCKEPLCVTVSKNPDGAMGVIRSLQEDVEALRSDLWSEGEMGVALYRFGMMQDDLKRYFGADTVHQAYNTANDAAFAKKVAAGEFEKLEAELTRLSADNAAKDARIEGFNDRIKYWLKSDNIQLHTGEMTAQELRSIKAVLLCIQGGVPKTRQDLSEGET